MAIHFFDEDVRTPLKGKRACKKWLTDAVLNEGKRVGEINFIFCSDEFLLKMNKDYLKHDTLTDVITFDYEASNASFIDGDIFISIERVKENATIYKTSFQTELMRVMVHGVLHLLGYKDKEPEAQTKMRLKEDYYLSLRV